MPVNSRNGTHDAHTWLNELCKSFLLNEFYVFVSETKRYPTCR